MKNDTENLITRKIQYLFSTKEEYNEFLILQKQYSNVLHFTYNRLFENNKLSTKELTNLQHNLKNISLNSHLLNSAIFDSKTLVKRNKEKQIIFGGKKLYFDRMKKNISRKEFEIERLSPITSIGETSQKGNRMFSIIDEQTIIFKPSRNKHFKLNLNISKKGKRELLKLQKLMNNKEISVSIKMNNEYVYLTFDYNKVKEENIISKHIKDRVFAIDQNPNYIGWSVIDWKDENKYKIIDKGVISLKPLNDVYFALNKLKNVNSNDKRRIYNNNKRKYEVSKISQLLTNLAKHYKCEIFSVEKLEFKNTDKCQKRLNSLCNNLWCRNSLILQIRKYLKLYQIKYLEVISNYSSFIGNLVYRKEQLPDMILSSIEISRRCFEFNQQYILKNKKEEKNIVLPKLESVKSVIMKSLEELNYVCQFNTLVELFNSLKKSKQKYRLSIENCSSRLFSSKFVKNQKKTYTVLYRFL